MQYWTKRLLVAASTSLLGLACLFVAGCEESPPPAPTPAELETAKKDREVLIRKEYGSGGFKKTAKK